jgi:hypothetical protein
MPSEKDPLVPTVSLPSLYPLLLGIKRKVKAIKRDEGAIKPKSDECAACSIKSKLTLKNGQTDAGREASFCPLCLPYTELDKAAITGDLKSSRVGDKSVLARIPSLSTQDTNHLLRAIGMAMTDPERKQNAEAILLHLRERSRDVSGTWETRLPSDFAAAMKMLSDEEYQWRKDAVSDLRIIFNDALLVEQGMASVLENPTLPVNKWIDKVKNWIASPSSAGGENNNSNAAPLN